MFTSFGARTTTVRTSRPSSARTTAGRPAPARAARLVDRRRRPPAGRGPCPRPGRRRSPSPRPAAPGRRSATRQRDRRLVTQPRPHVLRGVRREQGEQVRRPPRRPRGRRGRRRPEPASTALRVALTSSMARATATLNRMVSIARVASSTARAVARRSASSPSAGSAPGSLVTSPASRQARARNFADPAGDTSAQSMSSSGGPAKTIVSRTASTPCSASSSDSRTRLPAGLAHRRAVHDDHALVQQPAERLGERDHPQVVQDLDEEPRVQQVQDRVRDAADVLVDGQPLLHLGRRRRGRPTVAGSSSAGSTTTSRRTCPSCRCRAARGRRSAGRSC